MQFKIFLEDLKDEWLSRILEVLRYDLTEDIQEAVDAGIDRQTAESGIIDRYLSTHNFGWDIIL